MSVRNVQLYLKKTDPNKSTCPTNRRMNVWLAILKAAVDVNQLRCANNALRSGTTYSLPMRNNTSVSSVISRDARDAIRLMYVRSVRHRWREIS